MKHNGILKINNYEGSIQVYFGYPEARNAFVALFPKSMKVRCKDAFLFGNPVEGYDVVPTAFIAFDNNEKITGGVNEAGCKRRARFEKELSNF